MPDANHLCVCGHYFDWHKAGEEGGGLRCEAEGCACEYFSPDVQHPANQERSIEMGKQQELIEGRGELWASAELF